MINQVQANRLDAARRTGNRLLGGKPLFDSGPFVLGVVGKYMPWCITLDNSKGISRLRFWAKNSRVNGINDLPVFMHQGSSSTMAS